MEHAQQEGTQVQQDATAKQPNADGTEESKVPPEANEGAPAQKLERGSEEHGKKLEEPSSFQQISVTAQVNDPLSIDIIENRNSKKGDSENTDKIIEIIDQSQEPSVDNQPSSFQKIDAQKLTQDHPARESAQPMVIEVSMEEERGDVQSKQLPEEQKSAPKKVEVSEAQQKPQQADQAQQILSGKSAEESKEQAPKEEEQPLKVDYEQLFAESVKLKEEGNQLMRSKLFANAAGKYEQALQIIYPDNFGEFIEKNKERYFEQFKNLLNNLSLAKMNLGRTKESLQIAEKVIQIDSSNIKAHYRKALAHKAHQEYDEALSSIKKAARLCVEKQESNPDVFEELGRIKLLKSQNDMKDSGFYQKMFQPQKEQRAPGQEGTQLEKASSAEKSNANLSEELESQNCSQQLDNSFLNSVTSPFLYVGSIGLGFYAALLLSKQTKSQQIQRVAIGGTLLSCFLHKFLTSKKFLTKLPFLALAALTGVALKCYKKN